MCVDLDLPEKDRDAIVLKLRCLPEMEHTPKTIVSGVVYIVLGGQLQRVSTASGVSSVSIRKIVEKIRALESK
jgi:hypothetical protein